MTVREMLAELQRLPRDAELLAFEAGCEEYSEREVDEVEARRPGIPASWGPTRRLAAPLTAAATH
jgi:hypothetical protein